ncbi:MAG: HEAT repeat domain-containing protein, partial [Gallionella sp.]
ANDLSEDTTLSELGGIPLLLSVMIYLRLTGRVLPRSRLTALEELIKALLEDQPRRRAQAALRCLDQSVTRSRYIRVGIQYLAYRVHQEPNSIVLPNERAEQLLNHYYRTECELSVGEASDWTAKVLELGQHEFGILVAPQEHHIGVLHRIFQEYLAAKHLARLPLNQVKSYCENTGRKGPWHEVTLILMQLLERQDDVDELIEELRKPVTDCLEEPLQQILITRIAVTELNCSRKKACELLSQVFSWIEFGRWMPLRLALVHEVVAGLESEQVAALLAARAARWFPGRVKYLHNAPAAAAKQPTAETVSDLLLALHNCDSSYEYRSIAEALASLAENKPDLADELLAILSGPAEPELMGAALHALATGWPTHTALPSLLQAASTTPAKELRHVAVLARFNQGERSNEVRDALSDFCREGNWSWPWDKDIVEALAAGWAKDPQLMSGALERIRGIGHPKSWAFKPAIGYLLRGCPGDDAVARMLADQLTQEQHYPKLDIHEVYEALLAGFTKHPILVPAAEAWLDKNLETHHSPLDVAVIAKLGGTLRCRQALLGRLRRGESLPAWIISTLLDMSGEDDPEVHAVLADYISDEHRRSQAVRWLPNITPEPKELGVILRNILRDAHVFDSCSALELLVDKEGRDALDLWTLVESRLFNDKDGHYWRLGHYTLVKIWPEHPLIRKLVKETVYDEDTSISTLYQVYGNDPEIRPLLDSTMHVLHKDLRVELVRAIEPLVRRGVPAAVAIAAQFKNEPNGEARTVAARASAYARYREGSKVQDLIEALCVDLTGLFLGHDQRQQAAAAALLELGRADLLALQQESGQLLKFGTYSDLGHNWDFIAAVVENWDSLAEVMPDIWERFDHSPIIATELAKAGKGAHALSQTQVFENAVRTGKQLQVEEVQALIVMHGHSVLLRDLFLSRLQFMAKQSAMASLERAAYAAMASYLADHFHGDDTVGGVMVSLARSSLIHDVAFIALCQGWPDAPPILEAKESLPTLIERGAEPVTAWLFASKADAALMAKYLMIYPNKLMHSHFGEPLNGIVAVRNRLQTDLECRNLTFTYLRSVTEL